MPETEVGGQVKVGWLPTNLSQKDLKEITAFRQSIVAQVREEMEQSVDASTRPGFASDGKEERPYEVQIGRYRPEVKSDLTGAVLQHKKGGFLPSSHKGPWTDWTDQERADAMKSAIEGGFNVNLFPRGDIDNFSVTRWAMAVERMNNTAEAGSALKRYAPWETQYYHACEQLGLSNKAMGDMVSGSIPGRAA